MTITDAPILIDLTEASPFDVAPSIWSAIEARQDHRTYEERNGLPMIDVMERMHVEFASIRLRLGEIDKYVGPTAERLAAQNRPEAVATLYANEMEGVTYASRWTEF